MVNIHKVYNDGYELINVYTEELYSLVKDILVYILYGIAVMKDILY